MVDPADRLAVVTPPVVFVVTAILLFVVVGWMEVNLGTSRTAIVAVVGQLVGQVGASGSLSFSERRIGSGLTRSPKPEPSDFSTAIIAVVAVGSATLRSPWRLRVRALLCAYVAVAFLFVGSLADVQHLIVLIVALPLGERFFSVHERGIAPRTRQETRMLAFLGLW